MTDYSKYELRGKERRNYYIYCAAALFMLGMLFYRHIIPAILLTLLSKPFEKLYCGYCAAKRREKLLEGFRDVLYSISGSVAAGRQMPYAISASVSQLRMSYGEDADITREMALIEDMYRGAHGDTAALLSDFGRRSGLAEISQFASSYSVCRMSGGNLEEVCLKSANLLLDRISFISELNTMISQKKLDIILLVSLPLIILLFLNLVSFSYVRVLYVSAPGRLIMTSCLCLMGIALVWSLRITEIDI